LRFAGSAGSPSSVSSLKVDLDDRRHLHRLGHRPARRNAARAAREDRRV